MNFRGNMSVNAEQRLANSNGQWRDLNTSVRKFQANQQGENGPSPMLRSDPASCVRGAVDQYYSTEETCMTDLPENMNCNARYINGSWPYFFPFARDSASCDGGIPPDILPQILDANSIVQNDSWYTLDNLVLKLMMDGHIGQLSFSVVVDDVLHTYDIVFDQQDQIANDLYTPLIYRYSVLMSDLPPELNQRAILEINLTNGYVSVNLPMGNGSSLLKFVLSSILPVNM
jgi:hypothetical protein